MITDARAQVDLIAARHLEDLFKVGYFGSTQSLTARTDVAGTVSSVSSRAAEKVATWRTYLTVIEPCFPQAEDGKGKG